MSYKEKRKRKSTGQRERYINYQRASATKVGKRHAREKRARRARRLNRR